MKNYSFRFLSKLVLVMYLVTSILIIASDTSFGDSERDRL